MKIGNTKAVQFLGSLFPTEDWIGDKLRLTEYDYGHLETETGWEIINFSDWIVLGENGLERVYSHDFEERFGEIEEIPLTNRESSLKSIRG